MPVYFLALCRKINRPPSGVWRLFRDEVNEGPSDLYLWLTGHAGKMLRGEIPLSFTIPQRND